MALVNATKMGLNVSLGPKRYATVREDAILTTSFVATDYWDMANYSYASLFFKITQGSLTEIQWYVEYSLDATTWYRQLAEEVSLTDIENAEPPNSLPISGDVDRAKVVPNLGRYLRLQVKGVGTATGSSLQVDIAGL